MDRLRQRADFVAAAQGPRRSSPGFVVQTRLRSDEGPVRVGFTVTKKVGNAPARNRVRRRLRALLQQTDPQAMVMHSDYVIVGRRAALSRSFAELRADLAESLRRLSRTPGP